MIFNNLLQKLTASIFLFHSCQIVKYIMSENQQTGRIKSQRNMGISGVQSRLIKQYDNSIDYSRLNSLRAKYCTEQNKQPVKKDRSPLVNIFNLQSRNQISPSTSTSYVQQKLHTYLQEVYSQTEGTKNTSDKLEIIEGKLSQFKNYVGKVNEGIGGRLNDIQERLKQYRQQAKREKQLEQFKSRVQEKSKMKIAESLIKIEEIKKTEEQRLKQQKIKQEKMAFEALLQKQTERLKNLQKERELQKDKQIQREKQRQLQRQRQRQRSRERQRERKKYQEKQAYLRKSNLNFEKQTPFKKLSIMPQTIIAHQQFQTPINQVQIPIIDDTCVELQGQVKRGKQFTKQFTTFINRIKDQLLLDYKFTKLLLEIKQEDLLFIRQYLGKYHPKIDLSYFQITPIQMDPLHVPKFIKLNSDQQLQQLAQQCYKFYQKIQEHYNTKLYRKYSMQTVDMFFEEMDLKQISLGHIISYVNMRTAMQFRNRDLVKILRRLDICTHSIQIESFYRHFVTL